MSKVHKKCTNNRIFVDFLKYTALFAHLLKRNTAIQLELTLATHLKPSN